VTEFRPLKKKCDGGNFMCFGIGAPTHENDSFNDLNSGTVR